MTPIELARAAWLGGDALRRRRLRFKRYTFGDQWGDMVLTNTDETMSELELLRRTGHHPTTCNMILPAVTAIVGHYRQKVLEKTNNASETAPAAMSGLETDCSTLQEFLISGCAIQRLSVENRDGTVRTWADMVSPARFFIDQAATVLPSHMRLVGRLHDMPLMHVLLKFAHGNRRKASRLRDIFDKEAPFPVMPDGVSHGIGQSFNDKIEFDKPSLPGTMRVVELWTLECGESTRCLDPDTGVVQEFPHDDDSLIRRNNRRRRKGQAPLQRRWSLLPKWRCRYITASGTVIDEFYADSHPFVFAFYPAIDGEIHPMVEDLIDRQRHINRLLTLNDRIVASSAKGVLLFPENQTSASMPMSDVADNWAAPDGVVLYRALPGLPGPQQMVGSPSNFGLHAMVQTELSLISEVSGVSRALRGQDMSSSAGAELYRHKQEGATTALSHVLGAFEAFIERRDAKADVLGRNCCDT
ncbi:hypothetical protein [Muribaculum sp.]|jgi:hypothetical protein|uniref:portal protein n=1 Tax=Muribaculum sp. TaxID=1918611 RepID=UPI00257B0156|nr:hypothetical protein [Muribaculum sp.]